jgi:hypothetical protein
MSIVFDIPFAPIIKSAFLIALLKSLLVSAACASGLFSNILYVAPCSL